MNLGGAFLLFRTLSYLSIFDPFKWHLISIICVYGRQIFSLDALCHHEKCRGYLETALIYTQRESDYFRESKTGA